MLGVTVKRDLCHKIGRVSYVIHLQVRLCHFGLSINISKMGEDSLGGQVLATCQVRLSAKEGQDGSISERD